MGCGHACIYCYAPATLRYSGPEAWGTFVNTKVDIPRILEKEIRTKKRGVIGISTVTDPYQPLEAKLKLTRSCLEVLRAKDFPVCVQTKSALVLRDIDILQDFREKEVGFTITTLDDRLSAVIEPGASKPWERLDALRKITDEGIPAWAFVGPMVPGIIDKVQLEELLKAIKDAGASHVMIDRLRLKPGIWARIEPRLNEQAPDIADACRSALFKNDGTFESLRADAAEICREIKLSFELNY